MAHLQVAAGSGGVLASAVGAAELLNLLAQGLQSAVDLQVAVTQNVSVISAVHTEGIGTLFLGLGNETDVKSAAVGAWCSGGSGRSGRTLKNKRREAGGCGVNTIQGMITIDHKVKRALQKVPSLQSVHEVQKVQRDRGGQSYHPYRENRHFQKVPNG